jgi:hypothetical protein
MTKVTIRGNRTADAVKVEVDGVNVDCVSKIVINPILPDGLITAQITVLVDELDIALDSAILLKEAKQ